MSNFKHLHFLLLFSILICISNVSAQCSANAGPNISVCVGSTVQLGNTPAGTGSNPLTYLWSPATGLNDPTLANPVLTASTSQTYTLTVTSNAVCTATDNVNVVVNPLPVAGFNIIGNNSCANLPVSFTNTSTGTGLNYSWNFGDPTSGGANTSSQTNPTHTFNAFGTGSQTFTVTLIVTNSNGCTSSITHVVTVNRTPNPILLDPISDLRNCNGTNFDMTVYDGTSTTAISNYIIQWGDGTLNFTASTFPGSGVNHSYTTADIFTMTYIVTGTNGCTDSTSYNVANITNPAIGAANPGATTGCGPLTLCFPLSNYSSNHSTTYYVVNYGDGSPLDTLPHPPPTTICHTYTQSSCGQAGNQYVFKIKAINLCDSSEASISPIRVYTGPVANFNPAVANACVGTPVTMLNTTVTGFNSSCSASTLFQWNFGDGGTLTTATLTSPSHAYSAPGTYTVSLTTSNSCGTNTITKTVCIELPPTPNFTLSPATGCVPFITTISNTSNLANTCAVTRLWTVLFNGSPCAPGTAGFSFVGGTNSSSLNPQIQFTNAGNYTVRLTLTNSCGAFTFDQAVVAKTLPIVTINPIGSVCANTSISPVGNVTDCLDPITSYLWTFTSGTPSSANTLIPGTITYSTSGAFPITLSATNSCGASTATTSVLIKPLAPVLTPNVNSPLCIGDTAHFTSTTVGGISYSWSGPNAFSSNSQNFNLNGVTALQSGTYTVFGTLAGCPGPSSSVTLVVNPIPVITVSPNTATVCQNQSVSLTASGATNYTWSPATGLNTTTGATVTSTLSNSQTYTVTGNSGACSGSTTVSITVNPLPVVNAGPDTTVCNQPVPFQLGASPIGGTWTGSNVTATGLFTPSGPGSFTLTYSFTNAFGCSNQDTRIITVIAPTQANAGTDTSVCINSGNFIFTGLPTGGTWSGTNTSATGQFSPITAGTFPIVYTFGSSTCLTRDTLLATVVNLPSVNAGADFQVCINAGLQILNGTPIGGTWTGSGITLPSGTFNPSTATIGANSLTYTYIDPTTGCQNSDILVATVNPLPIVNAGVDTSLCNQPFPIQFNATPIGGSWSGPNVSPSGVFTPTGTGSFTIQYNFTNANGCSNSDSRAVTVINPTQPSAGNDTSVCIDAANVVLNGLPSGGIWTGIGVTSGGIFDPTVAGTFTLVYSFGQGSCLLRDTLFATVKPLPIVNAGSDFTRCVNNGTEILLGSPAGGSWTGIGITASSGTFNSSVVGAGIHNLTYTFTSPLTGCSASDVLIATINPLPVVNAGIDTSLCNQPIPVQLIATPTGGTWSGPNITSTGVFTPSATGTFTVQYSFTNVNGCTNTDSRIITVVAPIQPAAGADFAVCVDAANVVLNGTPAGGTWTGSGVTIGGIFDPTVAGTFNLVYSFGQGTCLLRDTLVVTVNPLPVVNAGPDFTRCINNGSEVLVGSPLGGSWTGTGITASSGTFNSATAGVGNHTITYTFTSLLTGCVSSDFLVATINPLPVVNAGIDTTLCNQPFPVQLTATPIGGSWTGPNVTPSGQYTPSTLGTQTLTYTFTNSNGCTNSDSRVITVLNPIQSNAGPDLVACIDAPNIQINGTPISGTWTGTDVSSSGVFNPTTAGNFTLVLSNGAGNCLTRDTLIFTVNPLPIVAIGPDLNFCPSDSPVNLTANQTGGVWTGNGITNSTLGTFTPSIGIVGANQIIYTYTHPITGCINRDTLIANVRPFPTANFNYNPVACLGISEPFTNTSTLANSSAWNFGDGNTSNVTSPSHTYTSAGFFTIELIVTSAFGCLDSITHVVEVRVPPVANFTLSPDSACAPVIVSFVDLSTGPSLSYNWNYGNGNTSTAATPTNQTYNQGSFADSTYTITLTLTNFCGTSIHSEQVIAMPSPTAVLGTATDIGCSPLILDMVNNSFGLPDTYYWDFGDGSSTSNTSAATLQHTYTTGINDTTFTITLAVSNECGTDTTTHTITVLPNQVNAFFNTNITSGCVPLTVNFTQFSQGSNTSSWDFGDGNNSTVYSPTHTFTTAGTYTVSLYANDGCGFDTTTTTITVFPSPIVAFSSMPDSVCILEDFTFVNQSVGLASSTWYFGDGDTSVLNNPTHPYLTSGTFTVTLVGVSQTNGCTASVTHPIVVSTNPVAGYTATPVSGCMPLSVQFTNTSTNTNFQAWNFGDGNGTTQFSPNHVYTSPGNFTVTLYVENANGCSDSIQQIITVYPLPLADFSFTSTDPCLQPTTATFTNNSTGALSYTWDFGDGQNSNLTNPSHTYAADGNYVVTLTAETIYGCQSVHVDTVHSYLLASASFTIPQDSVCVGELIQFVSTSSNSTSLVWDFGDGNNLTGNQVSYAFPGSGTFTITLIAYGNGGCNDTTTVNAPIVVMPLPIADFTFENLQVPDPLSGTVQFTNTSSLADSYQWEFGNGDQSTAVDPVERYNNFGDFEVTLIASTNFGCTDTIVKTVNVDFFYGLFIPNAINPGHSEFGVANFIPKGVGLKTFELLIYDDWGNLIWYTNALDADGRPTEYWDGTYKGEPAQQDAYVWKATATFLNEKVWEGKRYENGKIKRSGTVTIIR